MRILLLAPQPFYQVRGTPIAVRLLAETLAGHGHQLVLLTFPEGEDISIEGCRLVRLSPWPGLANVKPGFSWKKVLYDLQMFWRTWAIVRREKIDLIHAVEESAFIAWMMKKLRGIPYVYDMDSSLAQQLVEKHPFLRVLGGLFDRAEGRAIRGSSGVIVVCQALADVASRHAPGVPLQRLEDISLFPPGEVDAPVAEQHRIAAGGPVVMYVGNLESYQGVDLLITAFRAVHEQAPDAHLVIVGGAEKDLQTYGDRVSAIGLTERIQLIGPRPLEDLPVYLSQADILVSPRTKGNNTPMKIYSYLASGKPLVATRAYTHTQVLDDEVALLVDPTAADMADGLLRLLADEALRTRLGEAARRRAEAEHSRPAFERKLIGFYDRLLKS